MYKKLTVIITLICCLALIFSCDSQNKTPEHKHDYSKAKILQDATCTVIGVTEYYCECGAKITKTQDRLEHTWDNGKVIQESTVTEPGTIKYTCTVCSTTKEEQLPLHEHSYEWTNAESSYFHSYQEYYQCKCGDITDSREKAVLSLEGTHWKAETENVISEQYFYEYYEIFFNEGGNAKLLMGMYEDTTNLVGIQEMDVTYTLDEENMKIVLQNAYGGTTFKVVSEKENRIECESTYNTMGEGLNNLVFTPYDHNHIWDKSYLVAFDAQGHGYEARCSHSKNFVYLPLDGSVNPFHSFAFSGDDIGRCTECHFYNEFAMHFTFESSTIEALKNAKITIGDRIFMPTENPYGACCHDYGINYATEEGHTSGHIDLFKCDTSGPVDNRGWVIPEIKYELEDGTTGTLVFYDNNLDDIGRDERYEAGDKFDITRFNLARKDSNGNYIYWKNPEIGAEEEYKYGFRFILKLN